MEEVRQLVQEEGREARNLVAFHVSVDTPGRPPPRKPPRCLPSARRAPPRAATRLRSASAGRDKRSELRARYWALLFGDLQRAVGEIYNTVEAHESLNECQEVILVLENYTRDFKALGEWFRLKWEYDNTPPPQRPQSLAWEIRKTDFVRLDNRRTSSVKSSPSVSGKNSPSLSGHNTPSGKNSPVPGKSSPGSGKISPRIITSPKSNLEFFSNKIASKVSNKPEAKIAKETPRLSDIKERDIKDNCEEQQNVSLNENVATIPDTLNAATVINSCHSAEPLVMLGTAKESSNATPMQVVVIKSPKKSVENLKELSTAAKKTSESLESMENEFLAKNLCDNKAKNDNLLNLDQAATKELGTPLNGEKEIIAESPIKSEDNFADVSSESSPLSNEEKCANDQKICDENSEVSPISYESTNTSELTKDIKKEEAFESPIESNKETNIHSEENLKKDDFKKLEPKTTVESKSCPRPAYSQAAAKPKLMTSKIDTKSTPIARSKTVIEMRPKPVLRNQKQYPNKKNLPNKCSYPFNLTTGRSSLFDTVPNKTTVPKKPIKTLHDLASGDAKPVNRLDTKKRPSRPTTLKVNEKGDKKEITNPQLERIKDCYEYHSSDSIVTQIDMSRIESSDSLKTLVPDDLLIPEDIGNSIEVLNVDNNKNDNDGWLTVKSRRLSRESKKHSKSHWANRFNQPSATTSLPTLNMIESPKQENKSFIETSKHTPLNRAKSEQPQDLEKKEKVVKVAAKSKSDTKIKSSSILRQKSDVTGLKTRSSRNKALSKKDKKDRKHVDCELTKNRLHSSLESLTTGLSRSQESTEEVFDFDKWKEEFKIKFKYLDEDDQMSDKTDILKSADPSEMSEIAEMTSQIEENEKKMGWALDFQSEVDQRKLSEEEDLLNRQIMDLQQVSDIEIDTETDDTETDAEIVIDDHTPCPPTPPGQLGALAASLEDQYETALAGMSWAERVDTLVVLEALVARDPGRAQQLHAKLSQGIKRRGSLQDALRRLQAKQARAERQRLEYQTERAKRIHQLLARVEEVKVAKNQLIEEKRLRMERRLQKAAENRDQHLKDIVRKAHDEEEKLREIAFIKQLEAENRRHEFLDQCRSHTTRLRQMRRDRLTKLEEKAAREAAVVSRRSALEAARVLHMATLAERRREQHERLQQMKEMKSKEKGTHNRQKAEGVKSRLEALAAAAELEADALRSRIRDKQDASQQRLESHLQAIREKATGPRTTTSDSQELTAKEFEAERIEQERREKEKQKAIKKKARKIKQKLLATATDPAPDDSSDSGYVLTNTKLSRVLQQITNILSPLLDTDHKQDRKKNLQNGVNFGELKNNKQANNNKIVNGDDEGKTTKKSKKKKASDDKLKETEKQNSIVKCDLIIKKEITPDKISEGSDISRRVSPETEITEKNKIPSNDTAKKKNKKNKNSNKEMTDLIKPRLSKTNSVCSSLSDMSKTSSKSEKIIRTIVDTASLEKNLNELLRNMDSRFDKISQETFGRTQGLRVLCQLLTVAAERDDLRPQLSTKCLTSVVSALSRVTAVSGPIAAQIISSPIATHLVTLLTQQMEKDLQDPKELDLAKQLSDCLSIIMDAVLVSTRCYEESREGLADKLDTLKTYRSRAHTLISYLCLSGSITRAEKSPARESILTLLTLCADLCHPCEADVGSERQSALQSLRTALGAGLCGSRAELCGLFARGAGLEQGGGFVRAARVAHLLRATAELDHLIVQEAFGEGAWPLEFRAAVARLLSQHAPSDKEAPRTAVLRLSNQRLDQTLSEAMVLDLIVLVGFVVVNNSQLQETICEGWSVIKTLCTLPANWLVSKSHSSALLPTLIALAERPATAQVIAAELSSDMLEEFLSSPEAQNIKLIQVIKQGRAKKSNKK